MTEPVAFPPCDEVTLQPTIATDAGTSDGALLDEGVEVGVGDLLLGIGERDGLAVDLVEGLALEVVAELAGACPAGPCRPDSLPIVSWLPVRPTDCGVMIS